MDWGSKVTYLAETAAKGGVVPFGVKDNDRLSHVFVTGRTGSGRTTMLTRMALQDIERGMGVILLDASGGLSQMVLERLGEEARERVVFLDPSDGEHPFSWNPIHEFRDLGENAVDVLSEALASVYRISAGLLTAFTAEFSLQHPDATALLLYNLVTDPNARQKAFGDDTPERARFEEALKTEGESVMLISEHGRYIAKDTLVRNVLGQPESKFSVTEDKGAIIVVDLSRIRMFPTRITPLVRMFIHAARARGLLGEHMAVYLYDSLRCLSEEEIEKLFPEKSVAFAIAGTLQIDEDKPVLEKGLRFSGSVVTFSPNPADFPLMEQVFYPYVSAEDLSKLQEGELCVLLTIDSVRARPFFAKTLPPLERSRNSLQDIQGASRDKYTISRLKADQLFRPPVGGKDGDKGKGEDPGSFSNAFRSIFTKRAGDPAKPPQAGEEKKTPAVTDKNPAAAPQKPVEAKETPVPKKETPLPQKEEAPAQHSEIPEEDLRRMIYVDPIAI